MAESVVEKHGDILINFHWVTMLPRRPICSTLLGQITDTAYESSLRSVVSFSAGRLKPSRYTCHGTTHE